jgi:2-phospho-L-lactate guanylyltransferase
VSPGRPITWAIVPAKSLSRGKSRLSPVLTTEERARFAAQLLDHVLGVLRQSALDGVLVATDGDDVAEHAIRSGASVLMDLPGQSLAALIDRALAAVEEDGAGAAIVLMADLPLLEPRDIEILRAALESCDVALACDHLGRHTNALALAPPTAIRTCFGRPESFAEHLAAARAAGLRMARVGGERIAFDVDGPEDHRALTRRRPRAEI